jgi:hypothetical protein
MSEQQGERSNELYYSQHEINKELYKRATRLTGRRGLIQAELSRQMGFHLLEEEANKRGGVTGNKDRFVAAFISTGDQKGLLRMTKEGRNVCVRAGTVAEYTYDKCDLGILQKNSFKSIGEFTYSRVFDYLGWAYEYEWKPKGCVYKGQLSVDFKVYPDPENDPSFFFCVEVQGAQHYEFIAYFHKTIDDFTNQKNRDKAKKKYLDDNGIFLHSVPWCTRGSISSIRCITNELKRLVKTF